AERIRQQPWSSDMVLVAVTGWGQEEDRYRAEAAGFDAHFVKPVDPLELMRRVSSIREARVASGPA
ncbi:MAG TPA: hybrid sensor histidine kinase/response regulator, partial [Burkholderiaceae bacterium]|nr:hybrid sensor histidine kinase/response regulator [Burkholderiaceae bacterium]